MLGEGNERSSRTLLPWSYHLADRCASQASRAARVSLSGCRSTLLVLRPQSLPRVLLILLL